MTMVLLTIDKKNHTSKTIPMRIAIGWRQKEFQNRLLGVTATTKKKIVSTGMDTVAAMNVTVK